MSGPRATFSASLFRAAFVGGVLALLIAAPAQAVISPAQLLDGPSADLRELGGVAVAPDGSGGVVYRKLDGGRTHVFAAAFVDGAWRAPQRVDLGPAQTFASSWPAIGAGNGGRLVVLWVQEFGPADRLFSSTLQPGARRFESPVPVDLNIGDSALGTYPQVAMAAGGQALLSYRVITDAQPGSAPAGTVLGEIRVARLTGQLWSSYGTPVNRNLAAAQPKPSADNRPRVGIEQTGSGVVAWTELDDEFVPRVYARRVFAGGVGIAKQVTPRQLDGVRTKATDGFALAVGRYGEAAIAWRQQAAEPGAPSRAYLATMPDQFATDAGSFLTPRTVDGGGAQGLTGLAVPAVSIVGGDALVGLAAPGSAQSVDTTEAAVERPVRLDKGDAAAEPGTQVALGSDGSAVLAWKVGTTSRGSVRLQERREDAAGGDRLLTGPRGGAIDDLALAGSGLGDGVVAFMQGTDAGRQLVVGAVDAAPQTFAVQTPLDWVRSKRVKIAWDPAAHAVGGVKYAVVVDDDVAAEALTGTSYTLSTRGLDDGRRTVAVIATDASGQETSSIPAVLKLDHRAPTLTARVASGRRIQVRVRDRRGSGVNAAKTAFRIAGGKALRGRSARAVRVPRPGTYRVVVTTQDKAGNRTTLRRSVVVR